MLKIVTMLVIRRIKMVIMIAIQLMIIIKLVILSKELDNNACISCNLSANKLTID